MGKVIKKKKVKMSLEKKIQKRKHKLKNVHRRKEVKVKERRKEKKKEIKKMQMDYAKELLEQNKIKENVPGSLTVEDMANLIEKKDYQSVISYYAKPQRQQDGTTVKTNFVENRTRSFSQYAELDKLDNNNKKAKLLTDTMPVLTEDGTWKNVPIPEGTQVSDDEGTNKSVPKKRLTREGREQNMKTLREQTEDPSLVSVGGIDDNMSEKQKEEAKYKREISNWENKEKPVIKTYAQLMAERRSALQLKKEQMAVLATSIMKNPNELNLLLNLVTLMRRCDMNSEATARRFAAVTTLQVFHDLIPSFRVQPNAVKGSGKKLAMETWRNEKQMLIYYEHFLRGLEKPLDALVQEPKEPTLISLSETSLYCLGELLVNHSHFNFGANIANSFAPYLNHKLVELRRIAHFYIIQVFRSDKDCYITCKMIEKLYQIAKRKNFRLRTEVLTAFLAIRSGDMRNEDKLEEMYQVSKNEKTRNEKLIIKLRQGMRKQTSRLQKKARKKEAIIEQKNAEVNRTIISSVRNERHSKIVDCIFGIYFHILKLRPESKLMPHVLEGLAKFAHLINIDFFSDLLNVLNNFLELRKLGKGETLHCISTIFTILSGEGEHLCLDRHRFYKKLYNLMVDLTPGDIRTHAQSLLTLLGRMVSNRRLELSSRCVMSFAKRVATVALKLEHGLAIPFLIVLRQLMSTYSSCEALLETEAEGCAGIYSPDCADHEHANAAATALFELSTMQSHYHPNVKLLARASASGKLISEYPAVQKIINNYKENMSEFLSCYDLNEFKFSPATPHPSVHFKKAKQTKQKRQWIIDGQFDCANYKLQQQLDNYDPKKLIPIPITKTENKQLGEFDFYADVKKEKLQYSDEFGEDFTCEILCIQK